MLSLSHSHTSAHSNDASSIHKIPLQSISSTLTSSLSLYLSTSDRGSTLSFKTLKQMQTLALFFLTYNSLSLFLVLTLSLFTFLSITTISLSHYYMHSLSLQYNTLFLFNYYNLSLAILYSVTQTHTSDRPGICFAKNESISSSSSYSKVYFESSLK